MSLSQRISRFTSTNPHGQRGARVRKRDCLPSAANLYKLRTALGLSRYKSIDYDSKSFRRPECP
jgi:hypothetical protein